MKAKTGMIVTAILVGAVALVGSLIASSSNSDDGGNGAPLSVAITEGMSAEGVEEILGEPTATVELTDPETGTTYDGFKATYDGEGGSWVSFDANDQVTGYIIGGYTGAP